MLICNVSIVSLFIEDKSGIPVVFHSKSDLVSIKCESTFRDKNSKASNDFNPIHIDEDTAKKAGLSGIIVHGLCTMAMTMEKLISINISDDPSKLKSISLRFSSPVYPGDKLSIKTFDTDEKNKFNFEVENQSNIKVIKNGSFEVIG